MAALRGMGYERPIFYDCAVSSETAGIGYLSMLTRAVEERAAFIGPVAVMPGENELGALALGAYRIVTGEGQRILTYACSIPSR